MRSLPVKPLHVLLSLLFVLLVLASTVGDAHIATAGPVPAMVTELATWDTITEVNFEASFPSGGWSVLGNPTWGTDDFKAYSGGRSAWCARAGTGGRDPDGNDYLNNMNAFMKYGPFDLSDATAAELTFYLWLEGEVGWDYVHCQASADNATWNGWSRSTSTGGQWVQHSLDLCDVPNVGSLCGDDSVWVGIAFSSDGSNTAQGAFVDDIVVRKQVPTPTPPPTGGCVCESQHPYGDYKWGDMCTLYNPDTSASCTRVHFSRIDLGQGAVIRLKQGTGQTYQEIRGPRQATDYWSDCIPGTTVLVELETGSYPQAWGFCIDQVGETQTPSCSEDPYIDEIANDDCDGDYVVTWRAPSSAQPGTTVYVLEEATREDMADGREVYRGTGQSKAIQGHSPGTYYYHLMYINPGCESEWSAPPRSVVVCEPADTTPPTISNVRADPQAVNREGCGAPERVTIYADVTDDQSGVARVELHYQAPGEQWQIAQMNAGTGSTYSATLGPFAYAGTLQCYTRAFDHAGNDDYSAPALEVVVNNCTPPDTTPPMIYNVRTSANTIYRDGCQAPNTVTINASIIDDQSGLDWARLHYQPPGGSWTSVVMPYTQNGSYSASVTIGPFANAGVLHYYIEAADLAGNNGQSSQYTLDVEDCCALTTPVLHPIDNADCDADFRLAWSQVPGATEYWIRYSDNAGMLPSTDLWPAWTETWRDVTAPSPGTWYYQVRADAGDCVGDYSNVQSVQVWPVPLQPPLQPIINPDQSSSYDVNWLPVADADHYEYMESQNASFSGATTRTTTVTRLSMSGKGPGQWYYKVRACNCRDCGPWSVVQSTVVTAQVPVFLGNTSCTWGSRDCNPCANNVVAAFNSLRYRGDVLGFNLGEHPDVAYDESKFWYEQHWQGIQRIAAGDGRTMVVSHDNVNLTYSVLGVVRLDSRNGSGDRYRSNRLLPDVDISDTMPWSGDVIAQTVWIDDLYSHPGSIQSMGSYLVVGAGEEIHLYDFQNPLSPQHMGPPDPSAWDGIGHILYRQGKSGSSTAMGQLQDGRYLLVVANSDAKDLDFYVSEQPYSLQQPGTYPAFQNPYPWHRSQVSMGQGEFTFYYDWDTFQNISLVTECGSGRLYLVATGNLDITANCVGLYVDAPCYPNGLDYASLYQVQLVGGQIVVTKVSEHWFDCEYRGQRYCNFDAAAGVYVDPQGQLILYATEHASSGPANSINMMEFRPMPPGRCDNPEGAWVELYKDPGFTGRSIMIDYVDRDLENYSNYDKVEDFEDQASSVQWCLPPGLSYVLRQDKGPCGGGLLQLFGDGSMHSIPHLSQYGWDHPDGGRVSCSYFYAVTPVMAEISALTGGTLVYNTLQPSTAQGSSEQSPAAACSATEQGASTTVQIPPGGVSQNIELIYTPRFPPPHDPQPMLCPAYAFELDAQAGEVPLEDFLFGMPAQITIHYDGVALSEMVDESTLKLGLYDEAAGGWIDASTTCGPTSLHEHNRDDDWLSVGVCRIGEMALLGEPIERFMKLPIVLKSYDRSQRVRPTPTARPVQSFGDDFDGSSLAREWWWRNENAANWSLGARPGYLRVLTGSGPVWRENLLLRGAPNGDFGITTKVLFEPVANYQFAGLVLYEDDENFLLLGRAFCGVGSPACVGNGIYFDNVEDGQPVGSNYARPTANLDEAYLRVIRLGTTYLGYYSTDGEDWTLIGAHTLATANLSGIGLGTGQDQSSSYIPADFDFFEISLASE